MAIASVQQAAFGDHNIQYQFRTENNGGQVRRRQPPPPPPRSLAECSANAGGGGPPAWPGLGPAGPPRPGSLALASSPSTLAPLYLPLQVTYRVVQVTDGQLDGQGDTAGAVSVVSTAAFAGGQQAVTQVGVDGAAQRPGPAAASVPPGPAAPFPLVGVQHAPPGMKTGDTHQPAVFPGRGQVERRGCLQHLLPNPRWS